MLCWSCCFFLCGFVAAAVSAPRPKYCVNMRRFRACEPNLYDKSNCTQTLTLHHSIGGIAVVMRAVGRRCSKKSNSGVMPQTATDQKPNQTQSSTPLPLSLSNFLYRLSWQACCGCWQQPLLCSFCWEACGMAPCLEVFGRGP